MIEPDIVDATPDEPRRRSRRKFIPENAIPANAATWRSPKGRAKFFHPWRQAVGRKFSGSPRVLRVAWTLEWLFGKDCYAFATDSYLARQLGVLENNVQEALKDLEENGAIIRRSVLTNDKKAQRRIWASNEIVGVIPPTTRGVDTPYGGVKIPPVIGGQKTYRNTDAGLTLTQRQARMSARIAENSARKRGSDD